MTTSTSGDLRQRARTISDGVLAPNAEDIDRSRSYPVENLRKLGEAGLMGCLVPTEYGGQGAGLSDFAGICEELGRGCASTAMCFLMHCCGTALLSARASKEQAQSWLRPAAIGDAIATLAFSERATGAHFYQPEITVERRNGSLILSGRKSFVTSGGHADLYPVLVNAASGEGLDVLVLTKDMSGVAFEGEWDGIGMAGNSSVVMTLDNVQVPPGSLLGAEGDGQGLVFDVVAPTFLLGLSGIAVGISQAALNAAVEHAKSRKQPGGNVLAEIQAIQFYLAEMSTETEAARALLRAAGRAADAGDPTALPLVMQAKVKATATARIATDIAMQIGGGQAYSKRLPMERHLRDARAGSVMAPTNEILKEWTGKILAGLPLF